MNKILFLVLLVFSLNVTAQDYKRVYCELVGTGKLFSTKVTVTVDFGQENKGNQHLVDKNGKSINFNSMVDAMNYMGQLGWKFEQAYVVTSGQQNIYHWLLSKDIKEDERIDEGFTTKEKFKEMNENQ